jgi:hypothetical protein
MIQNRSTKPDLYYQRKWLGYIRYQGRIIKVNANYGCFMSTSSFEKLPENLKSNTRTISIIEPDMKHVVIALLTSYGLNQGFTTVEVIASRLLDFLTQLPSVVSYFIQNWCKILILFYFEVFY